MTKLYEILAVEKDVSKDAKDEAARIVGVFGQEGLLRGMTISYHTLLDGEPELPEEITELAHTVEGELLQYQKSLGSFIDVAIEKESSNTNAQADVFLNGELFLKGVPATALLNLESRLEELRKVYEAIPVIDMTEQWQYDDNQGCFVSQTRKKFRTKKVLRNHVLAEATKEHPAQVNAYQEDIPAYSVETVITSGMITPARKRELLERISKLQKAVKTARQRANDVDIVDTKVANKLFEFIHTGAM